MSLNGSRNDHANGGGVMMQRHLAPPATQTPQHNPYQFSTTPTHSVSQVNSSNNLPTTPKDLPPSSAPATSALTAPSNRFFGMENFGNTCYCNSVLQCLYYTKPFRDQVLAFAKDDSRPKNAAYPERRRIHSLSTPSRLSCRLQLLKQPTLLLQTRQEQPPPDSAVCLWASNRRSLSIPAETRPVAAVMESCPGD